MIHFRLLLSCHYFEEIAERSQMWLLFPIVTREVDFLFICDEDESRENIVALD